jgi:hypothetical protein
MKLRGLIKDRWNEDDDGNVYQPNIAKFKDFIKYDTPYKKVYPEKIISQVFSNIGIIMDDSLKIEYLSKGSYGHTFKFFHTSKKEWRVLKITSDKNEFNNSKFLSGRKIKGVVNIFECYPIKGVVSKGSKGNRNSSAGDTLFAIFMEYVNPITTSEYNKIKKIVKWYGQNYDEDNLIIKHFSTGLETKEWSQVRGMNIWESPFSYMIRRIGLIRDKIPSKLFETIGYKRSDFYKLIDFVVNTQKRLSRYKIPTADVHIKNIGKKNGEYKVFDIGVESKNKYKNLDFIEVK